MVTLSDVLVNATYKKPTIVARTRPTSADNDSWKNVQIAVPKWDTGMIDLLKAYSTAPHCKICGIDPAAGDLYTAAK